MEEEKSQPKVGLPLALIVILALLVLGLLESGVDLISTVGSLGGLTGFGIMVSEILNGIAGFAVEIWMFMMGARGFRQLGTFAAGTVINGLAGDAFGFLIEPLAVAIAIYFINHPEKAKGISAVTKLPIE